MHTRVTHELLLFEVKSNCRWSEIKNSIPESGVNNFGLKKKEKSKNEFLK